jgi:hypothetical protein
VTPCEKHPCGKLTTVQKKMRPIHVVALQGDPTIAQVLIAGGSDVNVLGEVCA